jgi:D-aspartate ligase
MDLVRPLGLAGVRSVVFALPGTHVRHSRFVHLALDWIDSWGAPEELVGRLLEFASHQPEPPVLFYENDWDLLLLSRSRDRLHPHFRFVLPDADLVEALLDKARFRELAERLQLPVPASRRITPGSTSPDSIDLRFPIVLKPLTRQVATWGPISDGRKAVPVADRRALQSLWPRFQDSELLAQELVPGPETMIESYHAYVDGRGAVAGEFAGRKIRTFPSEYGFSSAVETTNREDVLEVGRDVVSRLGLTGVAKLDFKRDANGALWLLEVNPRFSLWHHVGARAGVNLPYLVYADLVGLARPAAVTVRPGVRWCRLGLDMKARAAAGIPLGRWLPWALACEAKSVALDDPMPILRGALERVLARARRGVARR